MHTKGDAGINCYYSIACGGVCMASFQICGGCCLDGEVSIQGSKNAALPILSACLLAPGVTKLYNCPRIADVYNMLKILENIRDDDFYVK